jgi:predicted thioesterase
LREVFRPCEGEFLCRSFNRQAPSRGGSKDGSGFPDTGGGLEMRAGLAPGRSAEVQITVTDGMVARFDELGLVHPVYSTWMMAKHMEEASRKVILPFLEDDEEAVGHAIDVVHLAPTAVGDPVRVRAVLDRIEARRIHCKLEAFNQRERIGEGHNVQVVLSRRQLQEKLREIRAIK